MKLKPAAAAAALSIALAAPAAAQNSAAEPPLVVVPPPGAPKPSDPAPAPPPSPPPPDPAPAPSEPARSAPSPQVVPMDTVTISPDAAYPNGFADPADPFGNDMSLAYREEDGFDWGLLGLLGLLGLIPLFLRERRGRTIYVERDEEPRRAVRRERIEE